MLQQENSSKELDPWLVSRDVLSGIGRIQPVFSLAVRSLMSDYYKGMESMSPASMFFINRLMRSPTMKACVYNAVLTFHGESVANTPYLSSADLARMFKPGDLAALFGIAYYYRSVRKMMHQSPHQELWQLIASKCHNEIDLGGFIGYCVPEISCGLGMLSRGLIPLAHGIFLAHFPDQSAGYLTSIYKNNHPISFEYENNLWGCSCIHLISNMLQVFGFGMPWMNGAISTYSALDQPLPKQDEKDKMHVRLRYALLWMETLQQTGRPPTFKIPAAYYPSETDLFKLLYLANGVREMGSKYRWLDRDKGDISPSSTPQLFQEYLAESAPIEEVKSFCNQHISNELLDDLSESDFLALTTRDQETIDF